MALGTKIAPWRQLTEKVALPVHIVSHTHHDRLGLSDTRTPMTCHAAIGIEIHLIVVDPMRNRGWLHGVLAHLAQAPLLDPVERLRLGLLQQGYVTTQRIELP